MPADTEIMRRLAQGDSVAFDALLTEYAAPVRRRLARIVRDDRAASGPIQQAEPPSPMFAELQRRLAVAGIRAQFDGQRVAFSIAPPPQSLELARPVPHPWIEGRQLTEVGHCDDLPEFAAVADANHRLARIGSGKMPAAPRARAPRR